MRPQIIEEIERITGDRLTPEMREEVADSAIRVMAEVAKKAAIAATESAKEALSEHIHDLKGA